MLILHANIHVKAEHVEAFRAATIENATNSLKEPGIARFDFLQLADDPNRFAILEVYRNEEAAAAHKLTPHYTKWAAAVTDMMAEPRVRSWYKTVFPGDETW